MYLDSLLHSVMDPDDPLSLRYRYDKVFAAITLRLRKEGEGLDSLTIGGGGYTFPRYLEHAFPGSRTDVVEIDPEVTKAAKVASGLPETTRLRTFYEDARVPLDQVVGEVNRGWYVGMTLLDYERSGINRAVAQEQAALGVDPPHVARVRGEEAAGAAEG